MNWKIEFYSGVDESILKMPARIQARMIRLLELMEKHGANLGPPLIPNRWTMVYLKYGQKPKKALVVAYFAI